MKRNLKTGHSIECDVIDGCKYNPFVWISHKHKFIYFEVPKCASVTIKNTFNDMKHYYGRLEDVEDYYWFGFIRNPWSKIVSNYTNFFKSLDLRKKKFTIRLFKRIPWLISFNTFLKLIQKTKNHHWEPCYKFLPEDLSKMDKIGKMKTFRSDFSSVLSDLDIEKEIQKKNTTKHKHYKKYYNEKTRKIVENIYKKDIELFNFKY